MVLSSWRNQTHCESSPGSFDECRLSAWDWWLRLMDPSYLPGGVNVHPVVPLGHTRVHPEMASRSVHPFLQGSPVCPTHTDHATPSVAIGRIYAIHAMRPKMLNVLHQFATVPGHCIHVLLGDNSSGFPIGPLGAIVEVSRGIYMYMVAQKSKLLSAYVNKTEKVGGLWTKKNSYRENEVLSDIFTWNILCHSCFV